MNTNPERMLARSIADSISVTTPGRVTWHQIRRKRSALSVLVGWTPVVLAIGAAMFALVTR